jgi:hypothetical protein
MAVWYSFYSPLTAVDPTFVQKGQAQICPATPQKSRQAVRIDSLHHWLRAKQTEKYNQIAFSHV